MKELVNDRVAVYNGDTVEVTRLMPDNIFDMSVYSPPFSNLYTYSDSVYDMGNTKDDDEFFVQYEFLIKEKYRTHKNNTITCVHCKDLPLYKGRDGASGLSDFTGRIIDAHIKYGWVYQGKFRVWKDPVMEMQRTKNHGLLHKNYTQRSEAVRQGMADYVLIFKKIDDTSNAEIKNNSADFGSETILRCCELWANKTDNIVSKIHKELNQVEHIDFGFFEYIDFIPNAEKISKLLKNGRNITVACKESDIIKGGQSIGKLDNTVGLIEKMKKYNLVFHSRCYLTNGTELITFRKWDGDFNDCQVVRDLSTQSYIGKNSPIKAGESKKELVGYSIHCWQRYASPIWNDIDALPFNDEWTWFDINQTNVLNIKQAREDKDEKHICPLQIDLIQKCVIMYSKENDVCASFFGGIGSEPATFLRLGRRAYAVELKAAYFKVLIRNVMNELKTKSLF
ncbi:MAG: site-specific DNA-methyltransferase [Gammaproteobacteria bacterium]|nr:site-specific DNA-methyltransferase [Gammaproteobacteria bacterium]